ncbi:hypothetical protein NDI76_03380 [Halogeometricum sp. S1BR25-6]|uniref:Ribbon-helix-helix protein CopG domain-containing protein n=1 Tax=Halogeometricum salsisoli TaxID=2950536 RepID=A0ABU2GAF4_9EURY|nr:hypothetical protein [Halogeometricum sp. S1BR25-6]MDS0297775.1 hypothetical protein [Halogeometricum sp. S1BR25-6]
MTSKTSEAFAGRLPADEAALLKAAIEESAETESEIVRRALRFYIRKNPDYLKALRSPDFLEGWF